MISSDTEELDNKGLRNFGFTTSLIVVVLFGLLLPWLFNRSFPIWPWILAGGFCSFAICYPPVLRPIYIGWMKFGHIAGWVNTRIILAVLFYIIVLPMGLIMRLLGKDPMMRKIDGSVSSYRVNNSNHPKSDLEKPF